MPTFVVGRGGLRGRRAEGVKEGRRGGMREGGGGKRVRRMGKQRGRRGSVEGEGGVVRDGGDGKGHSEIGVGS